MVKDWPTYNLAQQNDVFVFLNRFQRTGRYQFMITKARDVPKAVGLGCDFGLTGKDFLKEYGSPDLDIVYDFRVSKSKIVAFAKKRKRL